MWMVDGSTYLNQFSCRNNNIELAVNVLGPLLNKSYSHYSYRQLIYLVGLIIIHAIRLHTRNLISRIIYRTAKASPFLDFEFTKLLFLNDYSTFEYEIVLSCNKENTIKLTIIMVN